MEYVIRFTQVHETFRLAEIEALALLEGISLEVLSYSPSVSSSPGTANLVADKFSVTILLCEITIRRCCHQTGAKKHTCKSNLRSLGKGVYIRESP